MLPASQTGNDRFNVLLQWQSVMNGDDALAPPAHAEQGLEVEQVHVLCTLLLQFLRPSGRAIPQRWPDLSM